MAEILRVILAYTVFVRLVLASVVFTTVTYLFNVYKASSTSK